MKAVNDVVGKHQALLAKHEAAKKRFEKQKLAAQK
jgi:hypothetical protein